MARSKPSVMSAFAVGSWLLLLAGAGASGCRGEASSVLGEPACAPGTQESCSCSGGKLPGVHLCLPDGSGFGSCSGCEADCKAPFDTLQDCGKCGSPCQPAHVLGASCEDGSCFYLGGCAGSYQDCDGNVANGCESDKLSDVEHCGACGGSCAAGGPAHVTKPLCVAGACNYLACDPAWNDCDGNTVNGCESDPQADVDNCGGCKKACAIPAHTTGATCTAAKCGYAACSAGHSDCDAVLANGCESSTAGDPKNCGGCGKACQPGEGCCAGKCGPPPIALSCADVQATCGSIDDGVYLIDPNGGNHDDAFPVFCDMSTEGGGWTFVAGIVPTDGNLVDWFNTAFWTDQSEIGDFANARFSGDYKSPAAWLVPGKAIMVQVAKGPYSADVVGYRGWAMAQQTYNSFFTGGSNVIVTFGGLFSNAGNVYAWEPLLKFGQELVANRMDNPNTDATRLGVTGRPFTADDNQPGLGTAMNLGCCGSAYRHADVELQWNTNDNIWCSGVGGDGTYKWLGSDSGCGGSCGSCQGSAGPGYTPAWNYRIYVR